MPEHGYSIIRILLTNRHWYNDYNYRAFIFIKFYNKYTFSIVNKQLWTFDRRKYTDWINKFVIKKIGTSKIIVKIFLELEYVGLLRYNRIIYKSNRNEIDGIYRINMV
jgi:hypothetical protein